MSLALDFSDLAYLIGGLGILVEWRAYYLAGGKAFRRWSAAAALLWAIQYLLLSAWTAGFTIATTALRTMLSDSIKKTLHKHFAAVGFLVLFGGITLISWQGVVSCLPAFAVINATLALFYLDNRSMRMSLLGSSLAWIANDYVWQAWPAMLAESVAMLINLNTIRKL